MSRKTGCDMNRLFRIRPGAAACVMAIASGLWGCTAMPTAAPGPAHEVRGHGSPAVVLESGFGMERGTWKAVVDDLSRDFTVFTHDRPGYGGQPDTDQPRDPCTVAAQTRQALRAAGLQPPYLLVGHSLGGLYQYAFAKLYPAEVSGLVLLDPTHPRNWAVLQARHPMLATALGGAVALQPSRSQRGEFRQQADCLNGLDMDRPLTVPGHLMFSRRYRDAEQDFAPALQELQAQWVTMTGGHPPDVRWDSGHHMQVELPQEVGLAVRTVAAVAQPASAAVPASVPAAIAVGATGAHRVTIGVTRQEEVRQQLGAPDEVHPQGPRTVWVYRAPGLRVPLAVSLIPILGDLADAAQMAQRGMDRSESIIEFDAQNVVIRARRRRVED